MSAAVFLFIFGLIIFSAGFMIISKKISYYFYGFIGINIFVGLIMMLNNAPFYGALILLLGSLTVFILYKSNNAKLYKNSNNKRASLRQIYNTISLFLILSVFIIMGIIVDFTPVLKKGVDFKFSNLNVLFSEFPSSFLSLFFILLISSVCIYILAVEKKATVESKEDIK